jgi:hypothetical protein
MKDLESEFNMNTTGVVRQALSLLLLTVCAFLTARTQTPQAPAPSSDLIKNNQVKDDQTKSDQIKSGETKFYADAHPYPDEPLPELKKIVPSLGGLKPAASQEQLVNLLAKVGTEVDELMHKVPDLISDEEVFQTLGTESEASGPVCFGRRCGPGVNKSSTGQSEKNQKFNFIILSHPTQAGRPTLEEFRIGRDGKPLPQGVDAPQFRGFVSTWIVFSPLNQAESRFRYLGEQKIDGHNNFVIAFAQIPGSVEHPGRIVAEKESVPMLLQGIAWVDESDFRIRRLRTDILAPQPEIDLENQSVNINFGRVRIAQINLELWLPQEVDAEMEARGTFVQEKHRYSRYRLYSAKSKIIY